MSIARQSGSAGVVGQPESGSVKSALRVLEILELLIDDQRPVSFSDIASRLGYPRSSLHGLLKTMESRGWLEFDADRRRYWLGIRAWEAGNAFRRGIDHVERARPYMEAIRDSLDETVQLAVLDGRHNVYLAKVDGSQRLSLASDVGRRLEAHATGVGKTLLAALSPGELRSRLAGIDLERFTPTTITSIAALEAELQQIRRRGYALDREEYTVGVRCVAVPIRDHSQAVVAAISVSVPSVRFDLDRQEAARELLLETAAQLSMALGYRQS